MKSDERRWGGEVVKGGKSHTYMVNLQIGMGQNSSSVREYSSESADWDRTEVQAGLWREKKLEEG